MPARGPPNAVAIVGAIDSNQDILTSQFTFLIVYVYCVHKSGKREQEDKDSRRN